MAKKIINFILVGVMLFMLCSIFNGCKDNNGQVINKDPFFSLQSAYNNNFIDKNDLKNIKESNKNTNLETLDNVSQLSIKKDYLKKYPNYGLTIDNVNIKKYLGQYGESVAIMINYNEENFEDILWNETIAGVEINYTSSQRILIYVKKRVINMELDQELEIEIKESYKQKFNRVLKFGKEFDTYFYGEYNGTAVIFISGDMTVEKTVTISGIVFSYTNSWNILVFKNNVFYNLEDFNEILEKGILIQQDIEKIADMHIQKHNSNI